MSRDGKHVWVLGKQVAYHKKIKFLLKISDRAWWLEVSLGINHVETMTKDLIKNVTTDLSAKICQTKNVLIEVGHPFAQTISAKTSESCVSDPNAVTKISSIPHVSFEENVGTFPMFVE